MEVEESTEESEQSSATQAKNFKSFLNIKSLLNNFKKNKIKETEESFEEDPSQEVEENIPRDDRTTFQKIKDFNFTNNKIKAKELFTKITAINRSQEVPLEKLNRGIYKKYINKVNHGLFGGDIKSMPPKRKAIVFVIVLLGTYILLDTFFPEEKPNLAGLSKGKKGETTGRTRKKKPMINKKTLKKVVDKIVPKEKQEEIKKKIGKMAENIPSKKEDERIEQIPETEDKSEQVSQIEKGENSTAEKKESIKKITNDINKKISEIEKKVTKEIYDQNNPKEQREKKDDEIIEEKIVEKEVFEEELKKSSKQANQDTQDNSASDSEVEIISLEKDNLIDSIEIKKDEFTFDLDLISNEKVTKNREELQITDEVLESLEKELLKKEEKNSILSYFPPPSYSEPGKYLVYNCTGKHWACLDLKQYTNCQKNYKSIDSINKKLECIPVKQLDSKLSCAQIQQLNIDKIQTPKSCSANKLIK